MVAAAVAANGDSGDSGGGGKSLILRSAGVSESHVYKDSRNMVIFLWLFFIGCFSLHNA